MRKGLLNILEPGKDPVKDQQIIDYLEGKLDAEAQHNVEEQELEDELFLDAMEGLQSVEDKSRLEMIARDMNKALQAKLIIKKNKRSEQRKWKDQKWITVSIVTLLLLLFISFLVVKIVFKS